jgi:hypothetical protein
VDKISHFQLGAQMELTSEREWPETIQWCHGWMPVSTLYPIFYVISCST